MPAKTCLFAAIPVSIRRFRSFFGATGPVGYRGRAASLLRDCHARHYRTLQPPEVAQPRSSRCRTTQYDSDPVERAAVRGRRQRRIEGDGSGPGDHRGDPRHCRARRRDDGSGPPSLRHRAQASGRRRSDAEAGRVRQLHVGHFRPFELPAAMLAAVRLPAALRRLPVAHLSARLGRPEGTDRQDPVRDLDRGNALLSERHLSPHP